MIKNLVREYKNIKMSAINKLSGVDESLYDENLFLDDGFLYSKIEKIKADYYNIVKDIEDIVKYDVKNDKHKENKLREKMQKKDSLMFELAFLSSNDFSQLEISKKILDEMDTDFSLCVQGLIFYKEGNMIDSFRYLQKYFEINNNCYINHYLANKVYAELLTKCNEHELALIYLQQAIKLRPENLELHKDIYDIYVKLGKIKESQIERNIIHILEG